MNIREKKVLLNKMNVWYIIKCSNISLMPNNKKRHIDVYKHIYYVRKIKISYIFLSIQFPDINTIVFKFITI